MTSVLDTMQVTCNTCGYTGSLAAVQLHSCDIQEQGGRCEDFPCCGHTDGGGCQTLPSHTAAFYERNPQFLHEPGSPEWFDALDDGDEHEPPEGMDFCKGCGETVPTELFDGAASGWSNCILCRIRQHVHSEPQRRATGWRWPRNNRRSTP